MRALGPDADVARGNLLDYTKTALKDANIQEEGPQAEGFLDAAGVKFQGDPGFGRAETCAVERCALLWGHLGLIASQEVKHGVSPQRPSGALDFAAFNVHFLPPRPSLSISLVSEGFGDRRMPP